MMTSGLVWIKANRNLGSVYFAEHRRGDRILAHSLFSSLMWSSWYSISWPVATTICCRAKQQAKACAWQQQALYLSHLLIFHHFHQLSKTHPTNWPSQVTKRPISPTYFLRVDLSQTGFNMIEQRSESHSFAEHLCKSRLILPMILEGFYCTSLPSPFGAQAWSQYQQKGQERGAVTNLEEISQA